MKEQMLTKAEAIMNANPNCVLALFDLQGFPTASIITQSKCGGVYWATYCTGLSSEKVTRIRNCNRASVCYTDGNSNVSMVGTVEILTDSETLAEMWYSGLEHHFTGPTDPNFCVLRFTAHRFNLMIDGEDLQENCAKEKECP